MFSDDDVDEDGYMATATETTDTESMANDSHSLFSFSNSSIASPMSLEVQQAKLSPYSSYSSDQSSTRPVGLPLNSGQPNSNRFIESDVKTINLDNLLRMWLSQLIDNSLDGNPTYVEVRLYNKSINGFDVLDNGNGYTQTELSLITKCL